MKKHYYLVIPAIVALISVVPAVTVAQNSIDHTIYGEGQSAAVGASVDLDTEVEAETPDKSEDSDDRMPVLPRLREAIRAKTDGAEANEETRNKLLNRFASTTREVRPDMRVEGRAMMSASSTIPENREVRDDLRKDLFEARKRALVSQLNLALTNLKQIRDRIEARITKAESEGRDMTEATNLLVMADTDLTVAQASIQALASFTPTTSATSTATSTTEATTTIDLSKPRQLGEAAISSVNDARKALGEVVRSIAHAMGLGAEATTTVEVEAENE